jgi:CheY-like chemotaxis protein
MEVKVVDTGQGISADFLPHVFERFRQADRATLRRQGLGLGLAIVRQLVELHGGTVHAASEGEGRGATFTIRLPILTTAAPAERWSARRERRSAVAVNSPQPRSQRLDDLHIVVVDDQADGRTLTSQVLTEAGASVTAVASAREALHQVLEGQQPDVLVSDIGLPEEDGYALVRQIRQHEAEHGGFLPAIALTAFTRAEDRTHILASGFQAHVSKPLDPAELIAAVAAVARGSATAGR